ncbi:MAG: HAMP domain-containing histidine kinase, partial [Rhizobacter sp.]|nr:HAMP domain-containing histidine kinase [Chlorobiales bacterium]
ARLELVAHRNFSENNQQSLRFDLARLTSALEKPIGQEDKLEQGLRFEPASGKLFHRLGIALALPLLSEKKELLGFWVLGEKKSGERFTAEDLSLLTSAAMHASLAIDRFHLQRELLLEKETSERLAELGEMKSFFVSSVSHELKTPLASIKLYAQLLQLPPTDAMPLPPETRSEYAEIIEGECDRLTRLVHSVLDFAKTERGLKTYHLTPQSLNGAVIHALKLMTYQFKMQNTVVTTALSEHHPTIAADRDALIEVLLNLLSNALKYSGAEKQITVRTEVLESGVVLAIDDNGIGIAAEDLTKIFEPFYRAAPSASAPAGGTGLGLALVKQIADAHHAILGVRSRIGIGSTFTVCFPTSQLSINLDQHA